MSLFYIKSCLNDYVLDIHGHHVVTSPRKEDSLLSDSQLWQLEDYHPDGTFRIMSKMHGKVMDCDGQIRGTKLILWDRHCGNNQRFRKEGSYIVSLSGLTLDIAGSNTAPGTHVILLSPNNPPSKNQMFEFEPFVKFFYIKSCLNDYVLGIPGGNPSTSNGIQVVTSPRKEHSPLSDSQLWQLDYQPDGTFMIFSKVHGKVLDYGEGTNLQLWDRHREGDNQRFRKEGSCIVSLSELTLGIEGSNTAPGTHVILRSRNHPPSKSQMFELEPFVNPVSNMAENPRTDADLDDFTHPTTTMVLPISAPLLTRTVPPPPVSIMHMSQIPSLVSALSNLTEPRSHSRGLSSNIRNWSVEQVVQYFGSIQDCWDYLEIFREHDLDGSALLLLTHESLVKCLGIKLGHALKIMHHVEELRSFYDTSS